MPFEIKDVQVPGDWVKVAYHKLDEADRVPNVGKAGQAQYRVDITVGGTDAKIGPMADKVRIATNSKHQPEYPISVTGVIRPTYRVEPTALNFGEVAPTDAAATRSVLLHSNDPKTPEQFVVTRVELRCSSPPPPGRKTNRKTYRWNGRKPHRRRCARTIFSMSAAARAPSHGPTSPTWTR